LPMLTIRAEPDMDIINGLAKGIINVLIERNNVLGKLKSLIA